MNETLAPVVCVFGTASDVGKSVVTTALCRLFSDQGHSVAPFKSQNMSNNSAVTLDGGEIGRAQFVQALAARAEPHVDMNPVLLKPSSDCVSQVIVLGKAIGDQDARQYFSGRSPLRKEAFEALRRLRQTHDTIVVEGAGSCAEVNLRANEFVNFPVAHETNADVILVADIDRGGVFGQVVGTLQVMLPEDRARVRGVIVNRFRGDITLFEDGVEYLEQHTGLPILGVLPFRYDLDIEAEDGLNLQVKLDPPLDSDPEALLKIGVIRLPHLSNFTDFDALAHSPGVALHYLSQQRDLSEYDLLILPGSKAVRDDLAWLVAAGWDVELKKRSAAGGRIFGICGGYQMLGEQVSDPDGVEGSPGASKGLGLLRVQTTMAGTKLVRRSRRFCPLLQCEISGYEIHMGRSTSQEEPLLQGVGRLSSDATDKELSDGAVAGSVWGTYLHGFFDEPKALSAFLTSLRSDYAAHCGPGPKGYQREEQFNLLAEHVRQHVDFEQIAGWLSPRRGG